MSPTKPASALHRLPRPVTSTSASAIPRRVRPTTAAATARARKPLATADSKSKSSSTRSDSIFHDSTATSLPPKVTSYFSSAAAQAAYGGDNKENIPVAGMMPRSRARLNGGSPTRGKTNVSKPSSKAPISSSSLKRTALGRRPLRELTEDEIFERDAAALGDLRRRRSGEHSGAYVEFDTHTAVPMAPPVSTVTTRNMVRTSSAVSSITSAASSQSTDITSSQSTAPTDLDDGKIHVMRRTDSEELQTKMESIMAAASSSTATKFTGLRRKLQSPMNLKHPAVKNTSPHRFATAEMMDSPGCKASILSPTKMSPALSRQSPTKIGKYILPFPARPTVTRMGLGSKSTNTILNGSTTVPTAAKGKKVIITSSNALKKTITAAAKKSTATTSLRRAAGASRPAAPSGLNTGLETLRRMR